MILPNPNSRVLIDVVASIRRRSKALKHKWFEPIIDRVLIREDGQDLEKLKIRVRLAAIDGTLTFWAHVFEDRWISIFARKRVGQVTHWDWRISGRLLNPTLTRSMVCAIEETSDEISLLADLQNLLPEQVDGVNKVWDGIISRSPEEVKLVRHLLVRHLEADK